MLLKTYITSDRGNATRLAKHLGVSLSYLSQMASGESSISRERCMAIEEFTGGLVTRPELSPDKWFLTWKEIRGQYAHLIPKEYAHLIPSKEAA